MDAANETDPLNDLMDEFYQETRVWPPGRDMPAAMCGGGSPDDYAIWRLWCDRRAIAAELAKCKAHRDRLVKALGELSDRFEKIAMDADGKTCLLDRNRLKRARAAIAGLEEA